MALTILIKKTFNYLVYNVVWNVSTATTQLLKPIVLPDQKSKYQIFSAQCCRTCIFNIWTTDFLANLKTKNYHFGCDCFNWEMWGCGGTVDYWSVWIPSKVGKIIYLRLQCFKKSVWHLQLRFNLVQIKSTKNNNNNHSKINMIHHCPTTGFTLDQKHVNIKAKTLLTEKSSSHELGLKSKVEGKSVLLFTPWLQQSCPPCWPSHNIFVGVKNYSSLSFRALHGANFTKYRLRNVRQYLFCI